MFYNLILPSQSSLPIINYLLAILNLWTINLAKCDIPFEKCDNNKYMIYDSNMPGYYFDGETDLNTINITSHENFYNAAYKLIATEIANQFYTWTNKDVFMVKIYPPNSADTISKAKISQNQSRHGDCIIKSVSTSSRYDLIIFLTSRTPRGLAKFSQIVHLSKNPSARSQLKCDDTTNYEIVDTFKDANNATIFYLRSSLKPYKVIATIDGRGTNKVSAIKISFLSSFVDIYMCFCAAKSYHQKVGIILGRKLDSDGGKMRISELNYKQFSDDKCAGSFNYHDSDTNLKDCYVRDVFDLNHTIIEQNQHPRIFRIVYPYYSYVVAVYNNLQNTEAGIVIFYRVNHRILLDTNSSCNYKVNDKGFTCFYRGFYTSQATERAILISQKNWKVYHAFKRGTGQAFIANKLVVCQMFNDCYGCTRIGPLFDVNCEWKNNFCISSSTVFKGKCLNIVNLQPSLLYKGKAGNSLIKVTTLNVNLKNNYMIATLIVGTSKFKMFIESHNVVSFVPANNLPSGKVQFEILIQLQRNTFRGPPENVSGQYRIIAPQIAQTEPNFALIGHPLQISLTFDHPVKTIYSQIAITIKQKESEVCDKFDQTGKKAECKFYSQIESVNSDLLINLDNYRLTFKGNSPNSKIFQIKKAPKCLSFKPNIFIASWKPVQMAINGTNLLNLHNYLVKFSFHILNDDYPLNCQNITNNMMLCLMPDLSSISDAEYDAEVVLETHGFKLDNFCNESLIFKSYPTPTFSDAEYNSTNNMITFKADKFIKLFPLNFTIKTVSGKVLSLCHFLAHFSRGNKHRCNLSKPIDLDERPKAFAQINEYVYEMGFVEPLGTYEARERTRKLILLIVLFIIFVLLSLMTAAIGYHYSRGRSIKPGIARKIAALRKQSKKFAGPKLLVKPPQVEPIVDEIDANRKTISSKETYQFDSKVNKTQSKTRQHSLDSGVAQSGTGRPPEFSSVGGRTSGAVSGFKSQSYVASAFLSTIPKTEIRARKSKSSTIQLTKSKSPKSPKVLR